MTYIPSLYVQVDVSGRAVTGEPSAFGLTVEDLDHIDDLLDAGREAGLGEMRYRRATEAEKAAWVAAS